MATQVTQPTINTAAVESAIRSSLTSSIESEIERFICSASFNDLKLMDAILTRTIFDGFNLTQSVLGLIAPEVQ